VRLKDEKGFVSYIFVFLCLHSASISYSCCNHSGYCVRCIDDSNFGAKIDLYQESVLIQSTTANIVGDYQFFNVPVGDYIVEASAFGLQSQAFEVRIRSFTAFAVVNFGLGINPGSISGILVDSSSTPIVGALVEVF